MPLTPTLPPPPNDPPPPGWTRDKPATPGLYFAMGGGMPPHVVEIAIFRDQIGVVITDDAQGERFWTPLSPNPIWRSLWHQDPVTVPETNPPNAT